MYHYAGNDPVRYIDPDGRSIGGKLLGYSCYASAGLVLAGGVVSVPTGQLYLTAGAAKLSLALAVAGAAMLAADAVNDGNNQASPSPLFGSNANVAAASPNPLPPDGDDEEPNFKNSKETAKEFRIDTKNYERNIKQDILKDSRKEAANNKQLHKF